jgi:hypothetical protein
MPVEDRTVAGCHRPRTVGRNRPSMFPYLQLWWPRFDQPVYVDRLPVWDGTGSCDPETGEILPIWKQARDQVNGEAHVLWFGTQLDIARIIAPSEDADRAVRYLTKWPSTTHWAVTADPLTCFAYLPPDFKIRCATHLFASSVGPLHPG